MNHEYEYYVKRFNYLNYGIVFDENPYCSDEITNNDWKRVSRSLARGYHGIAIFHSHDTIRKVYKLTKWKATSRNGKRHRKTATFRKSS